jgi:hypothetical protein
MHWGLGPRRLRRGAALLATALVVASAALACSLLVPVDDKQCASDTDCTARGPAFAHAVCQDQVCVAAADGDAGGDAGEWGCLDDPPEMTSLSANVTITFSIFDAVDPISTAGPTGGSDFTVLAYTPVPGITMEACNNLDPECASPATPAEVTDDGGHATFTVKDNFTGFFRLTSNTTIPSRLYMGQHQADASTFAPPAAILAPEEAMLLATALGKTMDLDPDAGIGHIFLFVYDCFDRHAPGVVFDLPVEDAGASYLPWYLRNDFPDPTATETDSLGAGGAINVPSGDINVTGRLAGSNRLVGTASAVILPGQITYAWMRARTH